MKQKDIDRLFQENLKDIEVAPAPKVWHAIEKKIKKKKRRTIPFWWLYGSIAAVFLLGIFLFFNNGTEQNKNIFPTVTNDVIIPSNNNDTHQKNNDTDVLNKAPFEAVSNKNSPVLNTQKVPLLVNKNIEKNKDTYPVEKVLSQGKEQHSILVEEKQVIKKEQISNEVINYPTNFSKEEVTWGGNVSSFKKEPYLTKIPFTKGDSIMTETMLAEKVLQKVSEEEVGTKHSSSDIFVTKEKEVTKGKKPLSIINKEERFLITNEKEATYKWAVSPVVGVLKSNSFTQASALDTNLNDNAFSGENTVAYGVYVSYSLNKKWTLQSGFQLQKSTFKTNNVNLFASANTVTVSLDNVINEVSLDNSLSANEGDFLSTEEGSLLQTYGYVEIPLEIKYTFFSSKNLQTSIVSGFSSLILNENSIAGKTDTKRNKIGESANLNSINFSGNIGFDIGISLSDKLKLKINPMFKAQLNTFSNDNSFRPYTIGVYTGATYQF